MRNLRTSKKRGYCGGVRPVVKDVVAEELIKQLEAGYRPLDKIFLQSIFQNTKNKPTFCLIRPPIKGICKIMPVLPLKNMEPMVGIEPTTHALRKRCSTTELHRRNTMLLMTHNYFHLCDISFVTRSCNRNLLGMKTEALGGETKVDARKIVFHRVAENL